MKQEHDMQSIRKQLDRELADVQFDDQLQRAVLIQASPPSFWNREVRIPGVAVAIVLAMLVAVPVIGWKHLTSSASFPQTYEAELPLEKDDKLIFLAGGTYYESELLEGWSRVK
jgi:hypothetical protein